MTEWSWPNARLIHFTEVEKISVRATRPPRSRTSMPPIPFRKKAVDREQNRVADDSWVYRASQKKVRAVATGVGMGVFGAALLFDRLFNGRHRPRQLTMAWNAVAGFAAGWFAMKTFDRERERRRNIAERLKMIGDLNHHVRNALQSIQLSAYSTQDQEIIASVGDSVQRIEWALREIVPQN
jgi:hypothetical protein